MANTTTNSNPRTPMAQRWKSTMLLLCVNILPCSGNVFRASGNVFSVSKNVFPDDGNVSPAAKTPYAGRRICFRTVEMFFPVAEIFFRCANQRPKYLIFVESQPSQRIPTNPNGSQSKLDQIDKYWKFPWGKNKISKREKKNPSRK